MNWLELIARLLFPRAVAVVAVTSAYAQSGAPKVVPSDPAAARADGQGRPQIYGFVDTLAAYTYASPAHWSRAVARLQLSADGSLADNLKWKLGGRVDVDPVYFSSNFYL